MSLQDANSPSSANTLSSLMPHDGSQNSTPTVQDGPTEEESKSDGHHNITLPTNEFHAIIARHVEETLSKYAQANNNPPLFSQSTPHGDPNHHRRQAAQPNRPDETPINWDDSWASGTNHTVFHGDRNPNREISPIKRHQSPANPMERLRQIKNFNVDKFVPDNDSPDKGFRRWRQKFEEEIKLNEQITSLKYPEDIKVSLLRKYTEGHTRNWLTSNAKRFEGKTTDEILDLTQRYLSIAADIASISEYLKDRKKRQHETFVEYKDRLLDAVNCLPDGVSSHANVNYALHWFLVHIHALTGKQSIEGCADTHTDKPWEELDKALSHVYRVTQSDGANYVPEQKKFKQKGSESRSKQKSKRKSNEANLVQSSGKDTKHQRGPDTFKKRIDFSKATCYICKKQGHTTNYHIKQNLPGTYKPNEQKPEKVEVSFVGTEESPDEDLHEESVYEAFIVETGELLQDLPVVEVNQITTTNEIWGLDSCASIHITHMKDVLTDIEVKEPVVVRVADGKKYITNLSGQVKLRSNGVELNLKNVYYVPELKRNLISVGVLGDEGYQVRFGMQQATVTKNGILQAQFSKRHGIFVQEYNRN